TEDRAQDTAGNSCLQYLLLCGVIHPVELLWVGLSNLNGLLEALRSPLNAHALDALLGRPDQHATLHGPSYARQDLSQSHIQERPGDCCANCRAETSLPQL